MSIIEACGRSAAISILLLLATLLLRDRREFAAARYAALFTLGVAAVLVIYSPPFVRDRALWLAPLRVLAFGNTAVFWVMSTALFDDEFVLSSRHVATWLCLVVLGFWAIYGNGFPYPFVALNGLSLICLVLALAPVVIGRASDLVESRRRLRPIFIASVGLFTAAITIGVIVLRGGTDNAAFGYVNAFGSLALAFIFAAVQLSFTPGGMFETISANQTRTLVPVREVQADDPREAALLAALAEQLDGARAYREETLNIAALAARLGVPEYRLRRLINQRLGHRNFSAFLNGYRLDEAMAALADASQADVPILTIGLDAGFNSIGSFNRTFKARTGLTPSEFRRRRLRNRENSENAKGGA